MIKIELSKPKKRAGETPWIKKKDKKREIRKLLIIKKLKKWITIGEIILINDL